MKETTYDIQHHLCHSHFIEIVFGGKQILLQGPTDLSKVIMPIELGAILCSLFNKKTIRRSLHVS